MGPNTQTSYHLLAMNRHAHHLCPSLFPDADALKDSIGDDTHRVVSMSRLGLDLLGPRALDPEARRPQRVWTPHRLDGSSTHRIAQALAERCTIGLSGPSHNTEV